MAFSLFSLNKEINKANKTQNNILEITPPPFYWSALHLKPSLILPFILISTLFKPSLYSDYDTES